MHKLDIPQITAVSIGNAYYDHTIKTLPAKLTKLTYTKTQNESTISASTTAVNIKFEMVFKRCITKFNWHYQRNYSYWIAFNKSVNPNFKITFPIDLICHTLVVNTFHREYPFIKCFKMPTGIYPSVHNQEDTSTKWTEALVKQKIFKRLDSIKQSIAKDLNYYKQVNHWNESIPVLNFYLFVNASSNNANLKNGLYALVHHFGNEHNYFSYAFDQRPFKALMRQCIRLSFETSIARFTRKHFSKKNLKKGFI